MMAEQINSKTKFGFSFGEIISLIITVSVVVGFYYSLDLRITKIEDDMMRDKQQINKLIELQESQEKTYIDIKMSLIRIEGVLNTKQDKYTQK